MEKIRTKEELVERLKDVLAVEITARDNYKQDVETFTNFEIVDKIGKIKKDEDKHIALLSGLINDLT